MKKINNNILKNFYDSYSFIIPKTLQDSKMLVSSQMSNWSFIDSYLYTKNFKQILKLLKSLVTNNKKQNKILFILDDDIYFFFEKTFKKHHFITNDIKNGLEFLQKSKYAPLVSGLVYIGKNNEISTKTINQLNIPIFHFSPKTKFYFDYYNYNALTFHGSILYLKLILKSVLIAKNINEKKNI